MGRLVFGVSCPNQPLQLTPAAILVSRAVQQFSSGRHQLNFAFGRFEMDATDRR